ncbi:50S ribosomal protein L4 [Pelagibacteraceae bacterium]|nr:50S ribosomal protein L4 [Pelagibacteraceae bacterium]
MKKDLFNLDFKKIKDISLDDAVFGVKEFPDIIHQFIRFQNAKSRQGSHKTKSRSEVKGGSKKPFSQKGTGNARQGSSKPPNFRGGATSMGPVNRDYSFSLNKKEKKLALKSTLSSKLSENEVFFIESFKINFSKTKELDKKLKSFKFNSALFVYSKNGLDPNFKRASSNLPRVSTISQLGLNAKDLISYDKIFIEENSIKEICERLL